jgi:signal transduction histidine kinase
MKIFLVRLSVEQGEDATVGYIATFDDITALQAAQRKAAWADVARRIAHEIKNPLTPIQLSAERLKRKYAGRIEDDSGLFAQTGPFPEASNRELVSLFRKADRDLRLLDTLGRLATSRTHLTGKDKGNIILKFGEQGQLEFQSFRDAPDALKALFEIERQFPGTDVVLVRADSSEDVRLAFKNYFSDAKEFVEMIQLGCDSLSPRRV